MGTCVDCLRPSSVLPHGTGLSLAACRHIEAVGNIDTNGSTESDPVTAAESSNRPRATGFGSPIQSQPSPFSFRPRR